MFSTKITARRGPILKRYIHALCLTGGYLVLVYCAVFCLLMDPRLYALDPQTRCLTYGAAYRFVDYERLPGDYSWYVPGYSWTNSVFLPIDRLKDYLLPNYTQEGWERLYWRLESGKKP